MKDYRATRLYISIWPVLFACLFFTVSCQTPIKIDLLSDNTSFGPGDEIPMEIRVRNVNTNLLGLERKVIARKGFFYQDFHLRMTIIDPEGRPVSKKYPDAVIEPAPPYRSENRFLVPVEIIPPGAENIFYIDNVAKYYHLGEKYGWYTAVVRAPLETFPSYEKDPTGEPFAKLFSWFSRKYNPLSSNKFRFEIALEEPVVESTIKAHVKLVINTGGAQQKILELENASVRLYRVSEFPNKYRPNDSNIYPFFWYNFKPLQSGLTYANGTATFSGIEKDDYLVLARHPEFAEVNVAGTLVEKDDAGWRAGGVIDLVLSVNR